MFTQRNAFVVLALLLAVLVRPVPSIAQGEVTTHELTDNVLVITGLVSNMTVVRTSAGLVIVDSFISPLHARNARALIARHFPHEEVRYVVNTHYHPDHNLGNQTFPEATVISHTQTAERLPSTAEYWQKMLRAPSELATVVEDLEGAAGAADLDLASIASSLTLRHKRLARFAGFSLRTADITTHGNLDIQLGGTVISLLHLGPGHTDGDLAVWIRDESVLATGDLVFHGVVPVFDPEGGADLRGWIRALESLGGLADSVRYVVPGHGIPGASQMLGEQATYLRQLVDAVLEAKEQGMDLEAAKSSIQLEGARPLEPVFGDLAGNIETAWEMLGPAEEAEVDRP